MLTNHCNEEEFRNKLKKASNILHDDIFMPEELRLLQDLALLLADIEYRNETDKSISCSYRQHLEREYSAMREIRLTDTH